MRLIIASVNRSESTSRPPLMDWKMGVSTVSKIAGHGIVIFALFLSSCSKSTFHGASEVSSSQISNQPESVSVEQATQSQTCGDQVYIQWQGKVKECIISQRKPFNFRTGECSNMKPTRYSCNWQEVSNELAIHGSAVEAKLQESQKEGGKLVACGVSEDGLITVFQWFRPPKSQGAVCSFDQSQVDVKTECFEINIGNDPIQIPTTEAERDQRVNECMQKVKG